MKTKKGSALLLSTILLFVVLTLVVSLSYITVMEQKMSQKTKSSVGSFFNADAGVEWALNKIANSSESTISGTFGVFNADHSIHDVPAGANYEVFLLGVDGKVLTSDGDISAVKAVRSVGTQSTGEATQRAIEAAVAANLNCSQTKKDCIGSTSCEIFCTNVGDIAMSGGFSIVSDTQILLSSQQTTDALTNKEGWKVTTKNSGDMTTYVLCCK
jgi:hypothetical protein